MGREREVTKGMTQVKECGADANRAAESGSTAVMMAAATGHTATAVALVRTVLLERAARVLQWGR